MGAVGRCAAAEIVEHFGQRVAAAGGHAQHHREHVVDAVAGRITFPGGV